MQDAYPGSVIEILDPSLGFPPAVINALAAFARRNPWSGTPVEREGKFRDLVRALADGQGIREPTLVIGRLDGGCSGCSYYSPAKHRIVLQGRLSVITFLHEYRHAWQHMTWERVSERDACWWSINLFRLIFPRQYARLLHRGHMLIPPSSALRTEGKRCQS